VEPILRRLVRHPSQLVGVRGQRLAASFRYWHVLVAALLAGGSPRARAAPHCDGPPACCPESISSELKSKVLVGVGVVLTGLYNVNERAGSWDGDYYLYESWAPSPGFTPQTEVVNEISSTEPTLFDNTELRDGLCVRVRRRRSTLQAGYDLRRFPFDDQRLTLQLSDAQYPNSQVAYRDQAFVAGLDEAARHQLSAWKIVGDVSFLRSVKLFKWEESAPSYDYATFSVEVRRHVSFHIARFFLPLFLVVVLAFMSFWVTPDDINTKATIAVTCFLAAVAFQFTQAGTLPEVSYLTFADRVYVVCYIVIVGSQLESVRAYVLARRGRTDDAERLDRRSCIILAAFTLFAVAAAAAVSM
jgi:hypothetical protein